MKKILALACLVAFAGCTQVEQVKEGAKNAPTEFWDSVHVVLKFLVDLVSGVFSNWIDGLLRTIFG